MEPVRFNKVVAQGEARFERLADDFKIPANATLVDPINGMVQVSSSETGHHHSMDATKTKLYKLPNSITECLLVVEKPDVLKHLRDFDTHRPVAFEPGTYKVTIGREYTPEGWRKSMD